MTLALYSLSPTLTKISSAPEITWLFVTTVPLVSIINPDPNEEAFLSVGLSKTFHQKVILEEIEKEIDL